MSVPPRRPWPKAILFDLDDTLWPIAPVIVQAEQTLYAWMAQHAPRVTERFSIDNLRQARLALLASTPAFQRDLGALRRAGLIAAFEEAGEHPDKVEQAMVQFFADRNAVVPYDDVVPALLRLKRRALLGSITNGNADLQVIGLAHHFQAAIAAAQFGFAKPDPAIFHAGCRALGVAPAEALYVGDDLRLDVQGAQQAGLRAVWLRRAGISAAVQDGITQDGITPDAVCADLGQLLDWLHREHG